MFDTPTPAPFSPWTDLYLPACARETLQVRAAVTRMRELPPDQLGDAAAVAARAMLVLDRPAEAIRLTTLAKELGGAEGVDLGRVSTADRAALQAAVAEAGSPGLAADACCDLAAAHLMHGDVRSARAAVLDALAGCRDHLEAAHWRRFLDWAPRPEWIWQRVIARERLAPTPYVQDVLQLAPRAANGWISPERLARRKLASQEPAEVGRALWRLREAGATGFWFALAEEYAWLEDDHPLVAMELRAEGMVARVDECRPAGGLAQTLWRAATDSSRADAAQLITSVGTRDDHVAPVAVEAAAWLLAHDPGRATMWQGYRAWHRHRAGASGATQDAMAVLTGAAPDPVGWYLAISTLFSQGATLLATRLANERLLDPELGRVAQDALREQDAPRPVTWLTPRLVPRFTQAVA